MANAKKKAAKKPAAKKQPEPEIQVNRTVNETTESKDEKDEREQQKAPTEEPDSGQDAPPSEDTEQTSNAQYEPRRLSLEHEGFDHQAAEDQRQAELAEQRIEHNRRTGDASRS